MERTKRDNLGCLFITFILVAVLLVVAVSTGIATNDPRYIQCQGQEVFESLDDYTAFKRDVAKAEIDLFRIEELNAAPPIIVQLRARLPLDATFSYGEQSVVYTPSPASIAIGVIACFVLLFGVVVTIATANYKGMEDGTGR